MQKLLRTAIVLLLLLMAGALVYSQTQLYVPAHAALVVERVARPVPQAAPAAPVLAAAPTAAPGTEGAPLVVRLTPAPVSAEEAAEREKDRQIQQGIEHYAARQAAAALANNFLLLAQAIIFFLILVVLFMLTENLKKFADAARASAEVARQSAELAESALQKSRNPGRRELPPHFYRKR